ncbi:hypothetical protein [Dyadobacter tibetensis]|uniref:hypothetical protein n=1 Tax=Dyadobacter tibetensis TaxID=1211851 RepID=UPI00046F028A|nr:hypothetical protein [Dyadobacter tibetensis]
MTEHQLLRIEQPKEGFSKKQKEFNLLSLKIESLHTILKDLHGANTLFRDRFLNELRPLHEVYFQHYLALVQTLDIAYGSNFYGPQEKEKLGSLIASYSQYLLQQSDGMAIKSLWEKYHRYAPEENQKDKRIEITERTLESPEIFTFQEKARSQGHDWSLEQKLHDRAEMEAGLTKAAVRKIYLDLIKNYHPDREMDEAIKQTKTVLMQEITKCYAEDNLYRLLQLQQEMENGLLQNLSELTSKALNHYIKGFKNQICQVESEIASLRETLALICQIEVVHTHNLQAVEIQFKTKLRQAKTEIRELREFSKALQDPRNLRAFLGTL